MPRHHGRSVVPGAVTPGQCGATSEQRQTCWMLIIQKETSAPYSLSPRGNLLLPRGNLRGSAPDTRNAPGSPPGHQPVFHNVSNAYPMHFLANRNRTADGQDNTRGACFCNAAKLDVSLAW